MSGTGRAGTLRIEPRHRRLGSVQASRLSALYQLTLPLGRGVPGADRGRRLAGLRPHPQPVRTGLRRPRGLSAGDRLRAVHRPRRRPLRPPLGAGDLLRAAGAVCRRAVGACVERQPHRVADLSADVPVRLRAGVRQPRGPGDGADTRAARGLPERRRLELLGVPDRHHHRPGARGGALRLRQHRWCSGRPQRPSRSPLLLLA